MAFIVELQTGCWLADWDGDPGRTKVESSAKEFDSMEDAYSALKVAREYRAHKSDEPFADAEVIDTTPFG